MTDHFTDSDLVEADDGSQYLTATGVAKLKKLAQQLAAETERVHANEPARALARMAPKIWMRHTGKSSPAPLRAPMRLERLNVGDDVDATRSALNALAEKVWAKHRAGTS